MTEDLARAAFETLAETTPPPFRGDVDAAAAAGARTLRTRRVAAGLAAALVVALVGAGGYLVARPAHRDHGAPAVPAASHTQGPTAPPALDPMVRSVTTGPLPARLTERDEQISATSYLIEARDPSATAGPTPGSLVEVSVTVHPDRTIEQGDPNVRAPERLTPAAAVHGHRAVWVHDGAPTLRWAYRPGSYAEVSVSMPDVDESALARTVANGVGFTGHAPVRLPFRFTPPPGLRPTSTSVSLGGKRYPWDVQVDLSDVPGAVDPQTRLARSLTIHERLSSDTTGDDKAGRPDRTVDGYPGHTSGDADSQDLELFDVHGRYVEMYVLGRTIRTALGPGGLLGLFRATHRTGNAVADWSDRPLG